MDNIRVDFSGDSGELVEMENVLMSGKVVDSNGSPISLYSGRLNLDELHNALYYINRTVIKLLVDEFEIDLDEVDSFLLSAISESLIKEYNLQSKGESGVNVQKVISLRRNNQHFD